MPKLEIVADPKTTSAVIDAWEAYAEGDWKAATGYANHADPRARIIAACAQLELPATGPDQRTAAPGTLELRAAGDFAELLRGMQAWHSHNPRMALAKLSAWLMGHDYFSVLIVERVFRAARETQEWKLLLGIARRYIERRSVATKAAQAAIDSAYALGRYDVVVELFRTYRELYDSHLSIQKAALALLHQGDAAEAEELLLALYARITGHPYRHEAHSYEIRRKQAQQRLEELSHKQRYSLEEQRELGMAYLLVGQSNRALRILETVLDKTRNERSGQLTRAASAI